MPFGQVSRRLHELHANKAKSLQLESADNRAYQPALDTIGFQQDERSLHEESSFLCSEPPHNPSDTALEKSKARAVELYQLAAAFPGAGNEKGKDGSARNGGIDPDGVG
jgi:hypothetical protein